MADNNKTMTLTFDDGDDTNEVEVEAVRFLAGEHSTYVVDDAAPIVANTDGTFTRLDSAVGDARRGAA